MKKKCTKIEIFANKGKKYTGKLLHRRKKRSANKEVRKKISKLCVDDKALSHPSDFSPLVNFCTTICWFPLVSIWLVYFSVCMFQSICIFSFWWTIFTSLFAYLGIPLLCFVFRYKIINIMCCVYCEKR